MKCRWADIFLDWLCCTDWGLFCVLDSKQVDIYGLCIQFCSWYIKLHSTKTMIKRWFKKNLKEKCKQFLLRCFALSSVCLPIYQRWQQASSGIEIKICNNQSSSKLLQFGISVSKIQENKDKQVFENVTWEQQSLPQHNLYLLRRAQFNIDWDAIWQCVQTIMANLFQVLKIVMPCISHSRNLYLF